MIRADCAMCPHTSCEVAPECGRSRLSGRKSAERQVWATFEPERGKLCFGWEPKIEERAEAMPGAATGG